MSNVLHPGDESDLQQAICNLCNGDSPNRPANVEIGLIDLIYKAALFPIESAAGYENQ